jgi:2-amino-4-hydroxy-6-hydroxymethyldihydropteridine diphosphokinase
VRDEPVYLGLGSNLGDRLGYLRTGLKTLAETAGVAVVRLSSVYETAPVGRPDQGPFLNAAAELRTGLEPEPLLGRLLAIEAGLGRVRERRWGPRVIDLDLLLWGERVVATERLVIPHPELARREFVLAPLAEIAPQARHPLLGVTVAELRARIESQGVRRREEMSLCGSI